MSALPFFRILATLYLIGVYNNHAFALETGTSIPDCQLLTMDKQAIHLSEKHAGKIIYIDFWASWCPPCAKSFPFMNKLHASFDQQDFVLLAINLDQQQTDAEAFLKRIPAQFNVLYDPQSHCAEAFNVQAMPSSYLIDREGVIRYIHLGFRSGDAVTIQSRIEELLPEQAKLLEKQHSIGSESFTDHSGH